ncbi:ArnT family glycosyltransferase [Legionella jordanis]|uniref:Melitin resistance protein n=1 Tax=Legionella jordanis TaxID=456 RepID=A0A0W0V8M2_9GAMM|nr:glycosyltransferase family 39 protein [Legionella jordanis]KTD16436.1 melitin resistance protein [Legionella jordanis]RMX04363.1 glycosyltransferase family 39 protein [Legionella jordanis]RMX15553.1 glycosyltransferase family 39 protein [Legionella jordanis]VEH12104.1 melitin resistance protein [Legionella jordanis]HAT8714999.1 phospholipid carrier-dependent glycosyltransferase [Legionella jordanis]
MILHLNFWVKILSKLQHTLILVCFSLLLLLPGITAMPVTDRDEAHFAQASRQMLQTGNYFQVRFQENTRFQKPPGINWLQAASVGLFSNADANEIWPYRIPSTLGALFSILLLYFFSRQFVNSNTAFLASALCATSLLLIVEAHIAVIDASLLSAVLLMQGALWQIYEKGLRREPVHWGWAFCFWFAMTYGMVLKGVTPLVGILTVISLCLIEKRVDWLKELRLYRGLAFFMVSTLAWLGMLNAAENSNYLMQMLHKDLLPKLQGGHESHGKPPLFHLAILPLTFWPASLFLWQGGVYTVLNRHQKIIKFLLAWIIPTWFFFEIMPTKLPQYVLPTFPAIALICALAINSQKDREHSPGKWLHGLQIMWGLLSIGFAFAVAILPYLVTQQIPWISIIFFVLIASMTVLAIYFAWHGAYRRASLVILLTALSAYPLIFTKIIPPLEPLWLSQNVAQLINQNRISASEPLLVVGYSEPSLVFNLNTKLVKFMDESSAVQELKRAPQRLALIDRAIFNEWLQGGLPLTIRAQSQGFNYTKGKWVELYLVEPRQRGDKNATI